MTSEMKTFALTMLTCIAPVTLKGMYWERGGPFDRDEVNYRNFTQKWGKFKSKWEGRYPCSVDNFRFVTPEPLGEEDDVPIVADQLMNIKLGDDERQLSNS